MQRMLFGIFVAWSVLGLAAAARAEVAVLPTDAASGIKVELEGWTGLSTPVNGRDKGLIPVTVTITNGSPADHVWTATIKASSRVLTGRATGEATPSVRIAVPAGSTGRATLFLGSATAADYGAGYVAVVKVSGHGISSSEFVDQNPFAIRYRSVQLLLCGVSKEVLDAQGKPFAGYGFIGAPLDMARAPEDWRGWSAFRNVLLTESEWRALAGGARKALQDWVATGGRAGVLVADRSKERLDGMGFPREGADERRRIGAGEIVAVPWDGTTLLDSDVKTFLDGHGTTLERLLGGYSANNLGSVDGFNKLVARFGERRLPVALIYAFLGIFCLVAGPINVMVLAGKGRRSRMFWTTPAISLTATALLVGFMLLRDGTGGDGARRVLALLAPERTTTAVIQEQFSRTGVLVGSSFPIAEPSWLQPVATGNEPAELLEIDGQTRRGDWFRSRSDQAFVAMAVRPSRARIEVVGGTEGRPPEVISSIEVPLERVFVIDEDGGYWTAEDVGTGEKTPLVASDAKSFSGWFDTISSDAGPVRRAALDAVKNLRGYAYATSRQARKVAVATLASIRWSDERCDFAGPFTRSRMP